MERRRGDRRPDRDGVDPLRHGEMGGHGVIAGIQLKGCAEDGAIGEVVGEAAAAVRIQAAAVVSGCGDDRGVQIDLVERPGHGEVGVLAGDFGGDGRRSRAGGLPGRLGGLLGGGDGSRGGLSRGFGGLLGGGGGRPGGGGRLPGGFRRGGCGSRGLVDGGLGGLGGGRPGLDRRSRVAGGLGSGLGGLRGGVRDGRGCGVTGRGCGVGSLGGSRSRGFRGGGRVGGVLRLGRLGGQGGRVGRSGGRLRGRVGGLPRGVGRLGGGGRGGLGLSGARLPGGDGRRRGLFRGRRGAFGGHGPGVGLVVVAAADQREAGYTNASLRAGSHHGATRDLSLSQGGPMVPGAHDMFLSGTRLSLCGTARCTSFHSIDRGGGGWRG